MYRLQLFGGPSIEADEGRLHGPPTQRHRLALLAILACNHPQSTPRDVLLDLLWPDRPPSRTRNLLNQAVHQIRKSLGAGTIRSLGDGLLLERAGLECDLLSFRDALAANDRAGAAQIHRAPFLQGFALPRSPGFERWLTGMRAELNRELAAAIEISAAEETAAGAHERAVGLWRRRAELDPRAEGPLIGLARALVASGDRSAALRLTEDFVDRFRGELGAEPDPRVVDLLARLRGGDPLSGIDPGSEDAPASIGATGAPGGARDRRSPFPPTTGGMVGRQTELERLQAAWRAAGKAGAGFALIDGVAGIGKTRLAEELGRWASRRGVKTARARSYATEGKVPFGPVIDWLRSEALRDGLEGLSPAPRSDLSRLLPELAGERWGGEPPDPANDWTRHRFFRSLAGAVLGRGEPRMLIIDDLQWSDSDTLQWLHFLLRLDPDARLLVVGTARLDEMEWSHPLRMLLVDLERDERLAYIRVSLEPLTAHETTSLGSAEAGRPLEEGEARRLFRETEGHPLLVVEGVRGGILADSADAEVEMSPFSARVTAIFRSRLDVLSPGAGRVAGVAAVVGRVFRPDLVSDVADLPSDAVADSLDELIGRRIVRAADHSFDFTHDKLREVVYADLGPMRRRLLHARVANALEARWGGDTGPITGEVAGHRELAGESAAAVALYRRAAELARGVHGYAEASEHLRRALALIDDDAALPPDTRSRLQLTLEAELGDSLLRTRGWASPEAAAAHERELDLAETVGDGEAICRALWGLQSVRMVRSEAHEARDLGERLLRLARERDDRLFTATGHFTIGLASYLLGEFESSFADFHQGIEYLDDPESRAGSGSIGEQVEVLMFCCASHAAWQRGALEEATGFEREARIAADRLESPFGRTAALLYGAILDEHRADPVRALERAREAIELGEEYGFVHYLHSARVIRGWAIAWEGRAAEGAREIRSALRAYRSIGSSIRMPYFLGIAAEVLHRAGRLDRALSVADRALATCAETGERWPETTLLGIRADILRSLNSDPAEIADCLRRAAAVARERGAVSQARRLGR